VTKSPDAFRTISEVADDLDLPQHVLRFWETRFGQIKPMKRGGGRRYYRPDDIDLLRGIRYLLYGEGYTIRGVQRILKEQGPRFVSAAGRGEFSGLPEPRNGDREPAHVAHAHGANAAPSRPTPVAVAEPGEAFIDEDQAGDSDGLAGMARRLVGRFRGDANGDGADDLPAGLDPDDAEQLKATLAELLECKRILDQAR
jgi:DNA-binding transcriptional MerR regulator